MGVITYDKLPLPGLLISPLAGIFRPCTFNPLLEKGPSYMASETFYSETGHSLFWLEGPYPLGDLGANWHYNHLYNRPFLWASILPVHGKHVHSSALYHWLTYLKYDWPAHQPPGPLHTRSQNNSSRRQIHDIRELLLCNWGWCLYGVYMF